MNTVGKENKNIDNYGYYDALGDAFKQLRVVIPLFIVGGLALAVFSAVLLYILNVVGDAVGDYLLANHLESLQYLYYFFTNNDLRVFVFWVWVVSFTVSIFSMDKNSRIFKVTAVIMILSLVFAFITFSLSIPEVVSGLNV